MVGLEWYPCCRLKPATRIPLQPNHTNINVIGNNVTDLLKGMMFVTTKHISTCHTHLFIQDQLVSNSGRKVRLNLFASSPC